MQIDLNLEHDKWVASEYLPDPQESGGVLVFAKLSGSRHEYQISRYDYRVGQMTWTHTNSSSFQPIYGNSVREVLEAVRKIDEPELAQSAKGEIK
jgi:hypothetical protein